MNHTVVVKKSGIIILFFCISFLTNAQISVNTTGSTADTSAMLDVSSTDKGMLVPRMTTAQRTAISAPAAGLLVFDTTTDSFWYYNGTAAEWQKVGNTVAGASEINELSDGHTDMNGNLFLGTGSGLSNVGGAYNTALGEWALNSNINSNRNIAIGYYAMENSISGSNNIAIGDYALVGNTQGDNNTACGSSASSNNLQGNNNVSLGSLSNSNNQYGNNNTIIGTEAGYGVYENSISGNIFLGYQAGYNETGNNKLYIENSNSATPLIGGDFANDSLFFNGVVRITGGNPGANKILTSDAVGNATWKANTAATEINELSDAIYDGGNLYLGTNSGINSNANLFNVGVGKFALEDNVGGFMNTSTGSNSLQKNTTGHNNTSYGYSALKSNLTANYNTAIGSTALQNNTATENTAVGYAALTANTSGTNNVSVGGNALKANINGHYNTAIGFEALQANQSALYNAAMGAKSLYNTTGERNTASGFYSLYSNTTGAYNTSLGYRSGFDNTTGTYNTFLGYNARVNNNVAKTNSTAVGNDAVITASNQVRIGNASVTDIGGYADWTNISDKRFKYNISEDVSGLDFIIKLRAVTYNLDVKKINNFLGVETENTDSESVTRKSNIRQSGFIAQEVEKAAKEIGFDFSGVDVPENENDYYGLRYAQFVVPLVVAVQEQQKMINQLKKENIQLKKIKLEIEELKNSMKRLQK